MEREQINALLGVDEEELSRLGDEYENDTWDTSRLGKVVMGRPRLTDEEMRTVAVRLPLSQIAELDRTAARQGQSRLSAIRSALSVWLKSAAM